MFLGLRAAGPPARAGCATCRSPTASAWSTGWRSCPARSRRSWPWRPTCVEVAKSLAEAGASSSSVACAGFPVAREGAQKFKEISYRHAEAYQTSELKHGPLALIDARGADRRAGAATTSWPSATSARCTRSPRAAARSWWSPTRASTWARSTRAHRRTTQRAGARPDPAHHPAPAAGLPRGAAPGSRHRQAAQPGEVGHGRVTDLSCWSA